MNIRFVEEAQQEFLDAISFYGEARAGLGRRFTEQVDRSVLWIAAHPELYRLRAGGYVRINLRIFPYYLPYIVRGQTLWVLAVAHGGRQPNYRIARRPELSWPRNLWRPQCPARGFSDPSAPLIAALHRGTITLNVMTSASYTFLRTIFSALVCIFLSAVSVSHAQNLLTNPGFEGTGTGSTTGWNAGGGTISASAAQKRSGSYSGLDADRTATWNSIYRNLLPLVSPGKSYRYSVWVRLGAGADATTSLVIAKTDGGPRSYTTLKSAFVTSTGWNQLSGIFTYSPRGTATELIACGDDAKMVIDEVTVDLAVQGSPITQKASGFLHGLGDMQPSQAHYEPLKPRIQRFPAFLGSPNMLGAPSGFSAPGYMNRLKAVGARQQIVLSDEYMWFGHHQAWGWPGDTEHDGKTSYQILDEKIDALLNYSLANFPAPDACFRLRVSEQMGFHLFTARTKHGANVRLPFTVTQQTEIASTGNITLNTQQLDLLRLIYPSIPLKLRVITTTFNDGVDD